MIFMAKSGGINNANVYFKKKSCKHAGFFLLLRAIISRFERISIIFFQIFAVLIISRCSYLQYFIAYLFIVKF